MTAVQVPDRGVLIGDIAIDPLYGCWLWIGLRNANGYAVDRRGQLVHRVTFLHRYGSIPADLDLDHCCRRRHCVRPEHLEPVTRRENSRRRSWRRRANRKRCSAGHRYDKHGRLTREGGRVCLLCAPVEAP